MLWYYSCKPVDGAYCRVLTLLVGVGAGTTLLLSLQHATPAVRQMGLKSLREVRTHILARSELYRERHAVRVVWMRRLAAHAHDGL